jgi:hypothetical protein
MDASRKEQSRRCVPKIVDADERNVGRQTGLAKDVANRMLADRLADVIWKDQTVIVPLCPDLETRRVLTGAVSPKKGYRLSVENDWTST